MQDRRLYGTWRSDETLTMRAYRETHPDITDEDIDRLSQLFGKLEVYYTDKKVRIDMPGGSNKSPRIRETRPYEVVARDRETVTIRYREPGTENDRTVRLTFEGDRYWIDTGFLREYFKRISSYWC